MRPVRDKFGNLIMPRPLHRFGAGVDINDDAPSPLLNLSGVTTDEANAGLRGHDVHDDAFATILSGGVVGREVLMGDGARETIIQISGPDDQSQVLSVVLTTPKRNDNFAPGDWLARIEVGVGGVQTTFDLDYLRGQSFSVPSSFLKVTAINDLSATGRTFLFGAFVSLKAMGNPIRPQRTIATATVAAGTTSSPNEIPPYAGNIRVMRQFTADGTPFRLQLTDPIGVTVYGEVLVGAFQQMEEVPIPNRATKFVIINDGANDNIFRGVFGINI